MKTKQIIMIGGTTPVLLTPFMAMAAGKWTKVTGVSNVPENFDNALITMTNWVLGFVGIVAVLAIVWGGVQYLTSAGSQDQARNAKETIKYALMGLFIAGLAYAIVNVVVSTILA